MNSLKDRGNRFLTLGFFIGGVVEKVRRRIPSEADKKELYIDSLAVRE